MVNLVVVHDFGHCKLDRGLHLHLFDFGFVVLEFGFLLLFFFLGFVLFQGSKFGDFIAFERLLCIECLLHGHLGENADEDDGECDEHDDDGTELELTLIGAVTISSVLLVTPLEHQFAPIF